VKLFRPAAHIVSILMLWVLSAPLLAQTSQQPKKQKAAETHEAPTADPRGTVQAPLIVQPLPTQKTQQEATDEEHEKQRQAEDRALTQTLAKATFVTGVLQVILLGFQIWIYDRQRGLMSRTADIMDAQRIAMDTQAQRMLTAAAATERGAQANERSAKAAENFNILSLRARMGFVDVEVINFTPSRDLMLNFVFENFGGKGARIERAYINTTIHQLPQQPIEGDWMIVGMPCEKGARWNCHVGSPAPPIDDQQWAEIFSEAPNARRLSIYGAIQYDIGFGGKIVTLGFCQQYDPKTSRIAVKPTFMTAGGKNYNHAE
jgi:hypothetical protein